MNEFVAKYKTIGGFYNSCDGEMLVEAENIIVAEKIARESIVESTGYATIIEFSIIPFIRNDKQFNV